MTEPRKLLTPAAAAEELATNVRHLKELRARGEIHATKVGRLVRYDPREIDRYIARNTEPAR